MKKREYPLKKRKEILYGENRKKAENFREEKPGFFDELRKKENLFLHGEKTVFFHCEEAGSFLGEKDFHNKEISRS